MKAFAGDLELLDVVTLILPEGSTGKIVLDDAGPPLSLLLSCGEKKDDADKEGRKLFVERILEAPDRLHFHFYNFKSPFAGYNIPGPLKLGTFKNRELFFNYYITFLGPGNGHRGDFSFYLGGAVPS